VVRHVPQSSWSGVDPFRVAGQSPAYACRVYATPAGFSGVPPLDEVISALTVASNREPISPERAVHLVLTGNHGTAIDPWTSTGVYCSIRSGRCPPPDGSQRGAALRNVAGGPASPPAGEHAVRSQADVSMTLGLLECQPHGDPRSKRRLGGLRVLPLAVSFSGLFVRAKRNAALGEPFRGAGQSSDLLRYLRYFVAVLAAREALTNSGKGLWPAGIRSG